MNLISQPFLFVRWLDAVTSHGWNDLESESGQGAAVEEVWSSGHLVSRDARQVRLASDVGTVGRGCNRMIAIPMAMVHEIRQDSMAGPLIYERRKRGKAKEKPANPQLDRS